jgi:hypothetical protein
MLGMIKRKAEKVIIDRALAGLKQRVESGDADRGPVGAAGADGVDAADTADDTATADAESGKSV